MGTAKENVHSVNWLWQARKLEHEISELCSVCVSVLLRCVLNYKTCVNCDGARAAQIAREDQLAREAALETRKRNNPYLAAQLEAQEYVARKK